MSDITRPKQAYGVVIFMAVFIVAALVLAAWDESQVKGWTALLRIGSAVGLGAIAGFCVELLDTAIERRSVPFSAAFRGILGLTGLSLAIVGIGTSWDNAGGIATLYPAIAGVGLARLVLWTWRRLKYRRAG